MDLKELNNDRRMISSAAKVDRYVDRGFSERARKLVSNYSVGGGVAFAFPLFGLDNIIYAVILWAMYAKLCSLANQSFGANKTKSFVGGFFVNLIVASGIELILSMIPGVNIIGAFIVGYFSIKLSGAAYLKTLEYLHNGNVTERYSMNNQLPTPIQNK